MADQHGKPAPGARSEVPKSATRGEVAAGRKPPAGSIRVEVSPDGIRAHLITSGVDPEAITVAAIKTAMKEQGIPVSDAVSLRVEQIAEATLTGQLGEGPHLLAEGREPTEGRPASFELAEDLLVGSCSETEDRTDFHRSQIVTVEAGAMVGTLTPAVLPVSGVSVQGKPVAGPPLGRSVQPGPNVELAEDGCSVRATRAGKIHITRDQVSVVPVVEIPGDVDFSSGNLDSTSDVLVKGTVRDSFTVKSQRSITIKGAIEGAVVEAGTDLQVNGGIASHNHGKVVAGGEIFAKFCSETALEAGSDITITRESMNSTLHTKGKLLIPSGKLIGGKAYARDGAEIGQLGNEANIKTDIALGVDPRALLEVAGTDEAIKKKQEAVAKIRQSVQPLMAQLKRLTPAQREKATELLYQADEMELEIKQHQQRKSQALQPAGPDGHEVILLVYKVAYPGTRFIFGDKAAILHKERRGPFKVVRRVHNRVEEILVIDKVSGSVSVLNSREYDPRE